MGSGVYGFAKIEVQEEVIDEPLVTDREKRHERMLLKIDDFNDSEDIWKEESRSLYEKNEKEKRPRQLFNESKKLSMAILVCWHQSRLELPGMTPYSSKIQGLLSVWSNTRNADHSRICYREC